MATDAKRVHIGEIISSFARLGDVYVVQIEHKPTGNEWVLVGEELSVAMEQCAEEELKPSVSIPTHHDELVEA